MPKWIKKTPTLRCVNCGFSVYLGDISATTLGPRARATLLQWIPSLLNCTNEEQLHKESVLCQECYHILRTFDAGDEGAGPSTVGGTSQQPRVFGHAQVCRACGCSVVKKRVMSLEARPAKPGLARVLDEIIATSPKHFEERAEAQTKEQSKQQIEERFNTQTGQHAKQKPKIPYLELAQYRLVRGNRSWCAVAGCREGGAPCTPLSARQRLLSSRRLYLPGATRLCRNHCRPNAYLTPLLQRKLSHTFTGEQIADMLFLMKPFPPLDADNVEAMDRHLRRSWLGVTWEKFLAKTQDNPSIPQRALAIRLCAQTSGECPEVLASLFQLPREEIDEALRVTEFLLQKHEMSPGGNKDAKANANPTEVPENDACLNDL